jgi:hypothetical protein
MFAYGNDLNNPCWHCRQWGDADGSGTNACAIDRTHRD